MRADDYLRKVQTKKEKINSEWITYALSTNKTGYLRKEILKRIVDELNKW